MDNSDPYVVAWKRWKRWAIALEFCLWIALAIGFSTLCFVGYIFLVY